MNRSWGRDEGKESPTGGGTAGLEETCPKPAQAGVQTASISYPVAGYLAVTQTKHRLHDDRGLVYEEPKTKKSGQPVVLPDVTRQTLQDEYGARNAPGADHMVILGPYGRAAQPDTVSQAFRRLARRTGFSDLPLKDLRHTHGSLMLASGANLKVVQDRLRHANIGTTADRYIRVLPGIQEDAVVNFEDRLAQEEISDRTDEARLAKCLKSGSTGKSPLARPPHRRRLAPVAQADRATVS